MVVSFQRCHIKIQRCHIKNMAEIRPKMEGVINFLILKKISTNLYDTFQKHTLYTRKVSYYYTLFSEGVIGFMTPYDTFMTPYDTFTGYLSALKYSWKDIFMTPFRAKSYRPTLQADSLDIGNAKGVIKSFCFVLKGVMKGVIEKYDTFHGEQEVSSWQF